MSLRILRRHTARWASEAELSTRKFSLQSWRSELTTLIDEGTYPDCERQQHRQRDQQHDTGRDQAADEECLVETGSHETAQQHQASKCLTPQMRCIAPRPTARTRR